MNTNMAHKYTDIPAPNGYFAKQLPNNIDSLALLTEALEIFAEQEGWNDATVMQINLVLEELLVNVIDNGYADGRYGTIDIQIHSDAQTITICMSDDGDAFDPFVMADPDLSLAVEDRPIGGLGIYLVRSYMDGYAYCYSQQHNQVTLTKHLPLSTAP